MLDNFLKDLAEVVNIDCGTANAAGVTEVAKIMKRHFDELGFATELVDLGPKVGNGLFATNKPDATHYDVLLNGHLDTVFPDGTAAARPMSIEGDHVKGPGCGDCKSGVLAILYGLKYARKEDLDRLAIAVCLNPDEETSSTCSREWIASLAKKSTRALVFEAARPKGQIVRARKGRSVWNVTFHGVASHAGNNPADGRSAILAACKFSLEVSKLQDLEGTGVSVNVGVIKGGTVANTVADTCSISIDTRRWNDQDGDKLDADIAALAQQNWGDGITVEAVRASCSPAMPFTEESKKLAQTIEEACRLEGFEATWVDAGGGSDANRIAQVGIPVIDGVGPAGGCFHSDREYLRIDTIEERVRMLSRIFSLL